jgi:hypothetical protein
MHEVLPAGLVNRLFRSAGRSYRVINDLVKLKIDLYQGLSHEIPIGIHLKWDRIISPSFLH